MRRSKNDDFRCIHCRTFVLSSSVFSGVKHRNHCPFCLWSRHLDLYLPGDRLSACKAMMRPVGLTFKRTLKKYGIEASELMVSHQCTDCGKISINRIAADDDARSLEGLLDLSNVPAVFDLGSSPGVLCGLGEINLLRREDLTTIRACLFGLS